MADGPGRTGLRRPRRSARRSGRMSRTFGFHPQAQAEFAADVDWLVRRLQHSDCGVNLRAVRAGQQGGKQ